MSLFTETPRGPASLSRMHGTRIAGFYIVTHVLGTLAGIQGETQGTRAVFGNFINGGPIGRQAIRGESHGWPNHPAPRLTLQAPYVYH